TAVDRHGPGVVDGAASAAGPVVGQGDAGNLHRGAVVVVDGPAVAQIVIGTVSVVARHFAAGDFRRAAVIDGAAGVGVVVRQDAIGDRKGGVIVNGAAVASLAGGQCAVGERQRAVVGDAAAGAGEAGSEAVAEGQAAQRKTNLGRHLEDARVVPAANGQVVGARPADGDALLDEQFAAGQCDGLVIQAWSEFDGVASAGLVDVGAQ